VGEKVVGAEVAGFERHHHRVHLDRKRLGWNADVCSTRMPARTRLLARSAAPVKSSAMQPSFNGWTRKD
jgi:hypothetical protein